MKKALFIIFPIIIISSLNAYGYSGYKHAKWWKNEEVVRELDLTTDQVDQIEVIFAANKEQITDLNTILKEKQRNLRSLIGNPNSSREDVLKLNDEVDHLKGKLKRLRLNMLLQIREVLTPDQRIKLREIRSKKRK